MLDFVPADVSIEKDKVVIFSLSYSDPPPPIYIWDLSADQVRTIGSFRDLWSWHMDVDENVLVTFVIHWDEHPPEVQQTKWALTGQLLDRKFFHLSLPDRMRFRPTEEPSRRTFGHKTVTRLFSRIGGKITMMDLMYDQATDKLNLRWIDYTLPLQRGFFMNECEHLTPDMAYQYNNALKGLDICNATNGIRIMLPYQLDIREVTTLELFHKQDRQPETEDDDDDDGDGDDDDDDDSDDDEDELLHVRLFGDQEVLCLVNHDGVQLWFFNPDFVPNLPDLEPFVAME